MINFPNAPVNGTTYGYLGIVYTYKDTGGSTGFWQITTPGTYGPASEEEVIAGTDASKYVTPATLNVVYGISTIETYSALISVGNLALGDGLWHVRVDGRFHQDIPDGSVLTIDGIVSDTVVPIGSNTTGTNIVNVFGVQVVTGNRTINASFTTPFQFGTDERILIVATKVGI